MKLLDILKEIDSYLNEAYNLSKDEYVLHLLNDELRKNIEYVNFLGKACERAVAEYDETSVISQRLSVIEGFIHGAGSKPVVTEPVTNEHDVSSNPFTFRAEPEPELPMPSFTGDDATNYLKINAAINANLPPGELITDLETGKITEERCLDQKQGAYVFNMMANAIDATKHSVETPAAKPKKKTISKAAAYQKQLLELNKEFDSASKQKKEIKRLCDICHKHSYFIELHPGVAKNPQGDFFDGFRVFINNAGKEWNHGKMMTNIGTILRLKKFVEYHNLT